MNYLKGIVFGASLFFVSSQSFAEVPQVKEFTGVFCFSQKQLESFLYEAHPPGVSVSDVALKHECSFVSEGSFGIMNPELFAMVPAKGGMHGIYKGILLYIKDKNGDKSSLVKEFRLFFLSFEKLPGIPQKPGPSAPT